ncbi:MAG: hypothetical protein HC848_02075 [Limnobacter sp.]|nr:hypothetical protein [Limnobacter sp.]
MKQTMPHSHQAGFIQAALLFGIALMTAILGGFALANRTPTGATDTEEAKVNASVILKQASDLRDGVQRYAVDFGSTAVTSTMTFNSTATTGLFDPAARYASPQVMPASVFAAGADTTIKSTAPAAGHWYFVENHSGNSVGTGTADPMVALPDIKQAVCQRINTMLYGSPTIPTITYTLTDVTTDQAANLATSAGTAVPAGWAEGCYQLETSSDYIYFKIVQEN